MFTSVLLRVAVAATVACSVAAPALAQNTKPAVPNPLTVVVPYAPGGASDRAARIVAEGLNKKFGTTVIVENRTGAGGRIAAQYLKTSDPSKDIVMLGNPAIMVVAPLVYKDLPYDPLKDFTPVAMATQYGFGVAVAANSPVKSLKDLVDWAKANPKDFNVAVPATGSLPHFFGLMLADKMGVKAEIIGYRGSAPAITDLIGGMVPVAIDTLDALTPQHEAGRIRIIATSGKERETALPKVPTFSEQGMNLESSGWNTFFASAGMPAAKVAALGQAIRQVTADPAVQKTLRESSLEPVVADAAESAKRIEQFRAQWEPVVKASKFVVTK
jgi:tripartite-type tricarboxylate transporter receptor subunit TctC